MAFSGEIEQANTLDTRNPFHLKFKSLSVNKWRFISVPGDRKYYRFQKVQSYSSCQSLELMWITDFYTKINHKLETSKPDLQTTGAFVYSSFRIVNKSPSAVLFYHSWIAKSCTFPVYDPWCREKPQHLLSWETSWKQCKMNNTVSPYFSSSQELEDFLAVLKVHKDLYPTDGVFIDIISYQVSWTELNVLFFLYSVH